MISWYAFGVVIGAPIIALFSTRFSLKSIMLLLAALCIAGNVIFTFSSSYVMLAFGRLVSGFPHGAFFGVGAIILSKIAPPGRVTAAVAGMIAGMTVANLVGVPAGTWLGHQFSWRYTFLAIALFDVAVLLAIIAWVPTLFDQSDARLREQFHFLKSPRRGSFSRPQCLATPGICVVQLYQAVYDERLRVFRGGDDVHYDAGGPRDGAGQHSERQAFRALQPAAHCRTTDFVIVVALLMIFALAALRLRH